MGFNKKKRNQGSHTAAGFGSITKHGSASTNLASDVSNSEDPLVKWAVDTIHADRAIKCLDTVNKVNKEPMHAVDLKDSKGCCSPSRERSSLSINGIFWAVTDRGDACEHNPMEMSESPIPNPKFLAAKSESYKELLLNGSKGSVTGEENVPISYKSASLDSDFIITNPTHSIKYGLGSDGIIDLSNSVIEKDEMQFILRDKGIQTTKSEPDLETSIKRMEELEAELMQIKLRTKGVLPINSVEIAESSEMQTLLNNVEKMSSTPSDLETALLDNPEVFSDKDHKVNLQTSLAMPNGQIAAGQDLSKAAAAIHGACPISLKLGAAINAAVNHVTKQPSTLGPSQSLERQHGDTDSQNVADQPQLKAASAFKEICASSLESGADEPCAAGAHTTTAYGNVLILGPPQDKNGHVGGSTLTHMPDFNLQQVT